MKTFLILGAEAQAAQWLPTKCLPHWIRRSGASSLWIKTRTTITNPVSCSYPFGIYSPSECGQAQAHFPSAHSGSDLRWDWVDRHLNQNRVKLSNNRLSITTYLVVSTGSYIRPEQMTGLVDGGGWRKKHLDFYTPDGAAALARYFQNFGRAESWCSNVAEMPIKCPVAPLEFSLPRGLVLQERGIRDKVDITFATPLPGAIH